MHLASPFGQRGESGDNGGLAARITYYDAITKWPDIILQSSILDVKALIISLLSTAKSEGLTGKNYKYDLNQPDVVRLGSFHPDITLEIVKEVEALTAKIKAGEFVVEPA